MNFLRCDHRRSASKMVSNEGKGEFERERGEVKSEKGRSQWGEEAGDDDGSGAWGTKGQERMTAVGRKDGRWDDGTRGTYLGPMSIHRDRTGRRSVLLVRVGKAASTVSNERQRGM